MKSFYQKLLTELDNELQLIQIETEEPLKTAELFIKVLLLALDKMRKHILTHKFKNEEEEIVFFKTIKPQLFSKLIFQTKVLNIETKRPKGTDRTQKKHLLNELDNLHRFFDNNLDFYQYYRNGATYLDDKYFVRGKSDIRLSLDTYFYISDKEFNTSHDFKVAKILANDLLEIYLKEQLTALDRKEIVSAKNQSIPKVKLTWTDNKASLIELIYALHHQGSFNNRNTDIKDIVNYFEAVFNIDLGDVYRSWYSIRSRKLEQTIFLDNLKAILQKKIEQEQNK